MQIKLRATHYLAALVMLHLLVGCAVTPDLPMEGYALVKKVPQERLQKWTMEGRLALSSPGDSWSASMVWQRNAEGDVIRLAGPLGQGAVSISLNATGVGVDTGDGQVQRSADPDQFVRERLGVFVPVRSLVHWVIGRADPERMVALTQRGFVQDRWQVDYNEWQPLIGGSMPRKVTIVNDQIKMKLVCDQWEIAQ